MADELSAQDKADLTEIRKRLPEGDPRRAKINTLLGPETSPASVLPKKGDWRDPLTRIEPHQMPHNAREVGREIVKGVGNIGAGGLGLLLRPGAAAEGFVQQLQDVLPAYQMTPYGPIPVPNRAAVEHAQEQAQQIVKQPLETAEQTVGQTGAGAAVGETLGGLKRVLPKAASRIAEAVTKTSPRETANLVKETQAANEAEAAKAAEKSAKQAESRKVDLRKHFEQSQAAKEANVAAEAPSARKAALTRGVEQLDPKFQEDLGALRKTVNERANAKYTALNAALDDAEATPEFLPQALSEAAEKIKGSNTEPTILKDMEKRLSRGDTVPYRDLQGYYTELGRELQKGTLPGDVYHAFDTLQEAVGSEMQRIADSRGLGPQLADARATWKQMKQTFYDPKSPIAKALKAKERGKAVAAFSGADQSGIEALAKYDPKLAQRANTIRGYQAEAKSLPAKPTTKLKSLPQLEPKPAPVQPKLKTIGAEDVRTAKTENLANRAEAIRNRGGGLASTFAVLDAIRNAIHGNIAGVGTDIAVRGAFGVGKAAVASLLERPEVVRLLTKPTAADLAQIPPEMRGDFGQLAEEATKRGIKVDPRLYAAAGAASPPKKGVAKALEPVGAP